jgi:hypothetical protein
MATTEEKKIARERKQWYYYDAGIWEKSTFRSICPTALAEPAKSNCVKEKSPVYVISMVI